MIIAIPMEINEAKPQERIPAANLVLICLNVAAYFSLLQSNWWVGPGTAPWTILTYGFIHGSILHLLINMWFLWVFGNPVNRRIGDVNYVLTYLGTIVLLGILAYGLASGYCFGSSGAVFAIVAMASMLFPAASVKLHYLASFPVSLLICLFRLPKYWLFWFIRWGTVSLPALGLAVIFVVIELFGLLTWLYFLDLSWTNLGHLLGFLCGIGATLCLPDRLSMPSQVSLSR